MKVRNFASGVSAERRREQGGASQPFSAHDSLRGGAAFRDGLSQLRRRQGVDGNPEDVECTYYTHHLRHLHHMVDELFELNLQKLL